MPITISIFGAHCYPQPRFAMEQTGAQDFVQRHILAAPQKLNGHTDSVYSITFSPDGTRIVSGSWDKTICVWDTASGEAVAEPFEAHMGYVKSVNFSPDGTRIADTTCI
jgi:WD40 repeat protein